MPRRLSAWPLSTVRARANHMRRAQEVVSVPESRSGGSTSDVTCSTPKAERFRVAPEIIDGDGPLNPTAFALVLYRL